MEKSYDFLLGDQDQEVTGWLRSLEDRPVSLDGRYTQEEDFFLVLEKPFVVESFAVNHDASDPVPPEAYLQAVKSVVKTWVSQVPGVFHGLTWYFDPQDLHHPVFVQVLSAKDKNFLFLLRADLSFRGSHGDLLDRGTNDRTPRYSTNRLFLESEVLPLATWETGPRGKRLFLAKLFPFTWLGESGRGYTVTGQWLDQEITRTLTRAALAPGVKTYPHYPLRCRYQTLSAACPDPTSRGRRRAAALLSAAWPLVAPWAEKIQRDLRENPFSEDHPLVGFLREKWGTQLSDRWAPYRIETYLNEHDQKEYRYHGE